MEIFGISIINIIAWAVFGLLVGYIVHIIDRADVSGGILATMLFGIAGALVGGFLAQLIFNVNIEAFSIEGLLTAVAGGLILAFIHHLLFRQRGNIKTTTTQMR